MSRIAAITILGALVGLTGCPGGDDTSTSNADDSTTSTTNTTPGTTTDDTTTTPPETTDTTAADTTEGMTTDPGTSTEPPATSTDETTAGVDACAMCVETECAAELEACMEDVDCTCFRDCAEMMPGMAGALACAGECGIPVTDLLNDTTVVGALSVCSQMNCPKCL